MVILPALPSPKVLEVICAPLVRVRLLVLILTSPALPTAPFPTKLSITLLKPLLFSPFREILSVALIVILPALPSPKVLAEIRALLFRVRLLVLILISPALPTAPC